MHKLEIKLKQHTPLIHFQHDQEGATLRASEVKPKLDKYIIKHTFYNSFDECKQFLVGYDPKKPDAQKGKFKAGYRALNYKMRIEASGQKYEHKIKIINANKMAVVFQHIQLTIFCPHALQPHITDNLPIFFVANNFGFRQSKGYGSFTIEEMRLDGEKQQLNKLNYSESLISSQQYEKVCSFKVYIPNYVTLNLKKYISEEYRNDKDKNRELRNNKDKNKELNKQCTIPVPIEADSFNSQFVFSDYKERIRESIDKRIKDLKGNSQSIIKDYLDYIINGLSKCKNRELDGIHNDFLYEFFKSILDKGISDKYQCYKSGRNMPYSKSKLRNFYGNLNNKNDIVYWDKRFIKQRISELGLNPKLKDTHIRDGRSEISVSDSRPDSDYLFIRALLGLEGNFEFQTQDNNIKFVVVVVSKEEEPIERFQSIITFKVIDEVIYTCIKPKRELKEALGKRFLFTLTKKEKRGRDWVDSGLKIELGEIPTPNFEETDIDKLYKDIVMYFANTIDKL